MQEADADKILGKWKCGACGYRSHSESKILKHILEYHPNMKEDIRKRYNELRGLD